MTAQLGRHDAGRGGSDHFDPGGDSGAPLKRPATRAGSSAGSRIEIIEALRGLAALAVAWFHFTLPEHFRLPAALRATGSYGWLGVEVFFVLSGFVIPYSLWRSGYRWPRDWGVFVAKRIIRLEPPYLVSIGVLISLHWLSSTVPGFMGHPPAYSAGQVLSHLGYVSSFLGYEWISPVFWTLALEFQFYLLMAVVFRVLVSEGWWKRTLVILAFWGLSLALTNKQLVFAWLSLFSLGCLSFQRSSGRLSPRAFAVLLSAGGLVTAVTLGPLIAAVGFVTALLVATVRMRRIPVLAALGTLSYSLYLLHLPIGGRVVNLGSRLPSSILTQVGTLAAAVVASLGAAAVFWWILERPSQALAGRLKYLAQRRAGPEGSGAV